MVHCRCSVLQMEQVTIQHRKRFIVCQFFEFLPFRHLNYGDKKKIISKRGGRRSRASQDSPSYASASKYNCKGCALPQLKYSLFEKQNPVKSTEQRFNQIPGFIKKRGTRGLVAAAPLSFGDRVQARENDIVHSLLVQVKDRRISYMKCILTRYSP